MQLQTMTLFFTISINNIFSVILLQLYSLYWETILRKKSMVFVYTAMGVLCVEHANVLELCYRYIELLSGDGSPYSILSDSVQHCVNVDGMNGFCYPFCILFIDTMLN